jgi:hypothetical protein
MAPEVPGAAAVTSALATALWLWDPNTASTVDMLALDDCAWGPASLDNANMAIVAVVSSPCLGPPDNSYPFNRGLHSD